MAPRPWWRWWRRTANEREIAEELAAHVALRADAYAAGGMSEEAAGHAAARRLGSELALRERTRLAGMPAAAVAAEELLRDVRLAGRGLRRSPGFTLLAVLTLALGIGATTAMFSVVRTVLLDTLPFPDPQRLVMVESRDKTGAGSAMNFENVPQAAFHALRRSGVFASVGYSGWTNARSTIYVDGLAVDGGVMQASPDLFTTLEVRMELGHGFRGSAPQAVVTDQFWREHLRADPAAVGRPLRVNDQLYTLAGVLPPGQEWPSGRACWLNTLPATGGEGMIVARLRSGEPAPVALRRAQAAVTAVGARAAAPWRPRGLVANPLRRHLAQPEARTALWVLLAAAVCLLMIASLNTANLLLARGVARAPEFAIRRALGATRLRLVRQALAEGLWLAGGGAAAGAGVAWVAVRLARLGPAAVPRLHAVRVDGSALLFVMAVALASGIGAALVPALRLSGWRSGAGTHRLRSAMLILEIALTLALLVGGLALAASYSRLWNVDPGFAPQTLVGVNLVAPSVDIHTRAAWTALAQTHQRLRRLALDRIRALPGVIAAGYGGGLPFDSGNSALFAPAGQEVFSHGAPTGAEAEYETVGPGYFQTLGVPLLSGRWFTAADFLAATETDSKAPQPILINPALAQRFFPGQSPLGRQLASSQGVVVVVGVVGGTRDQHLDQANALQAYQPDNGWFDSVYLVSTRLPLGALVAELRQAIAGTPLHMAAPVPLEQAEAEALGQPRFRAWLMGAYAALALALSLAGLYGVLAFEVRQRRQEIGVRMALGADPRAVVRLVFARGLRLAAGGAALGAVIAWLLMRALGSLLYATSAFDPVAWLPALAALLLVLTIASAAPARRAARVDPAESLRCE